MKRKILIGVWILVCFLLQCTVFHALSFGGIIPNLLIILTSSYGFMGGRKNGLMTGFLSGLLLDIFFGEAIGFYALIYMYIGYINGNFRKIFFPEDIKLPLCLIAASDLAYNILCYSLLFLLRSRFQIGYYFIYIILPEVVYTVGISLIMYPVILRIDQKLTEREKRSAKKFV
ncbi:rod shape-determining protein MreD [Lachnospiraceae bacterium JLR.KK008]